MKCMLQRSRAIDDKEKAARKESILDAARTLYQAEPEQLPSVITIAKAAGLAKGTVYLYFKTKEEIFLNILGNHYSTLLAQLNTLSEEFGGQSAPASTAIPQLVDVVVAFAEANPDFMPLAAMGNSVLEPNVDVNEVLKFKAVLVEHLMQLSATLANHFPDLTTDQCQNLLIHTNALVLGLWQMQNLPKSVVAAMQPAHRQAIVPDFAPTLREAMTLLWRGALTA